MKSQFRHVALIGKYQALGSRSVLEDIAQFLGAQGCEVTLEEDTASNTGINQYPTLDAAGIDIPVCGLAKKLEEVWTPGASYPIILSRTSDGMFLLQRVRDEAHRVALRYQRSTRSRVLGSELSEIEGVGPTTVKSLLRHFGSVARVKKATHEQLLEADGVGPRVAEAIGTHLGI